MSASQSTDTIYYLLLLILPLSALFARRVPLGPMFKMAAMWIAIFGVGLVLATLWSRNRGVVDGFLVDAGLSHALVSGDRVELARSEDGQFHADVQLNGVTRRMLIDTGASQTTISRATAKAAGIEVEGGFGVLVNTANGRIINHRATAGSIELGSIRAHRFPLLVTDADDVDLIGIDFLSALKSWHAEGNRLVLEPRRK